MTLMSKLPKPPTFKPFKLALIQLGSIGANKTDNLKHAREMILKAASGKPDLIVLPVSIPFVPSGGRLNLFRNASIHRMDMFISQYTRKKLALQLVKYSILKRPIANP